MKTIDDIVQIGINNKTCTYDRGIKKANECLELFGISTDELYKIVKYYPYLLGADIVSDSATSVKSKLNFFKETFSLSDIELIKLIKTAPDLLNYDTVGNGPTSINGKIKFYKETLHLDDIELAKIVKLIPQYLSFDTASIEFKLNFYKNLLGLSDSEVILLIKSAPALLCLDVVSTSPTSVKSKLKFYKDNFSLTDKELTELIKFFPMILAYDIINVKEARTGAKVKLALLNQMGVDKEDILKNPILLAHPATRLRIRFMILNQVYSKEDILKSRFLMTPEDKTYARLQYLLNKTDRTNLTDIKTDDAHFIKKYGITTTELKKLYPLDEKAIEWVENQFNKKNNSKWKLTPIERKAVLSKKQPKENDYDKN